MSARIRDKFPTPKKIITVRVRADLYRDVMKELEKNDNTYAEFVEASMKAFLEESETTATATADDHSQKKDDS